MARVITKDLDEMRSLLSFSARRTVKLLLRIMAAIEFQIGAEMDFFSLLFGCNRNLFGLKKLSSGVIRITTESLVFKCF